MNTLILCLLCLFPSISLAQTWFGWSKSTIASLSNSVGWESSGDFASALLNNTGVVYLKTGMSHTAIENAAATRARVYIPPGTYSLGADTLVLRNLKTFTIEGAGRGVTNIVTTGAGAVYIANCDSFIVRGITIKGGTSFTFLAQTCKYFSIEDIEVTAAGNSSVNNCQYFTIDNTYMHDNQLLTDSNHGWEINRSKNGTISNIKVHNVKGKAIELWADPGQITEYISVTNVASKNNRALFMISSANHNVLSNCTSQNDTTGIIIQDSSKHNIIANNIIDNRALAGTNTGIQVITVADSNDFVNNIIVSESRYDTTDDARKNYFQDAFGIRYRDDSGFRDGRLIFKPTTEIDVSRWGIRIFRPGSTNTWGDITMTGGALNFVAVHPSGPQMDFYTSTNGTSHALQASITNGFFAFSAIPRFNGSQSTGAGAALLGANSPAVTLTAPYTWIQIRTSDGSTAYIPVWK